MLLLIYILVALFIAWIWVDYYRQIDIYDRDDLKYLIGTFALGCLSVLPVFAINHYLLDGFEFGLTGEPLNDLLYCIFGIGAVEEFSKFLSFISVWFLFRKQLTEPIDYLAYFCTVALGFAAVENVLYFNNHGSFIISGRAILSTVTHMFASALVAYGIVLYKYHPRIKTPWIILAFFALGSLSHGLYDFWLMMNWGNPVFRFALALFYFLLTLSFFAIILNNAINNSSYFSYRKAIDSNLVVKRLLTYYGLIFGAELLINLFYHDFYTAFGHFQFSLFTSGAVVMITVIRMSRFQLMQNEWQKLKLEFPFHLNIHRNPDFLPLPAISVKGESYNEAMISTFFEQYFELHPVSLRKSYIKQSRKAIIYEKMYPHDHQAIFRIRLFIQGSSGEFRELFIRPKVRGTMLAQNKYVIVGLYRSDITESFHRKSLQKGDLKFLEWAYIKPVEE